MNFKKNILLYVLLPLTILFIGSSYIRFVVLADYMVTYEGECDQTLHSCFTQCDDDACTTSHTYSEVVKYAPYVQAECGDTISNCAFASECLAQDHGKCSITYCNQNDTEAKCQPPETTSGTNDLEI